MKPKKILIILEATLGGIRKHVIDLITGILSLKEFEITFVYSLERADEKFFEDLAILSNSRISLIKINITNNFNPLRDFLSYLYLSKIVISLNPDIIHMHGAKAAALGRLTFILPGKRKYIYTPHGGSFHKFKSLNGKLYLIIEKILSYFTNCFIAVSQYSFSQIRNTLKINENKIFLIYNGIDPQNICYLDKKKETTELLKYKKCDFVVLYPALFLEAKGHIQFLEALGRSTVKLNRNIKILLAGSGPLESEIRFKINLYKLEDVIEIIGFKKNLAEYYQIADLVILLSISEVFGYVILESMAYSKPIIATKIDAFEEIIVDGKNGILIDQNDINILSTKLNYLMNNKTILLDMGRNGNEYIKNNFPISLMVEKTISLYKSQ